MRESRRAVLEHNPHILAHILLFIEDKKDLCRLSSTSAAFREATSSPRLWQELRGQYAATSGLWALHGASIKSLDISHKRLSDSDLVHLRLIESRGGMSAVRARAVGNTVFGRWYDSACRCCPNLAHLDVSGIDTLTRTSLASVLKSCKKLRSLYARKCGRLFTEVPKCKVYAMGYLGPQHCQGQRKGRRTGTAAGLEQVLNECEPLPVLLQLDVRGSVFDLGSGTSALAQLVARLMAPQPTHLRFGWLSESASHLKLWARQRRLEPKQQVPVEFVHGVYTGLLSTLMRHLQPRAHSLLELDMSGCHFAGPEVEPVLRHLRSVTQLRLNQVGHCNFTNGLPLPDPSSVAQIPSRRLHTLNLRGFGLVEDAHVRPVLQNNPQLRRLNLSLTCVSDNLLLAIPALCPGLEMLDVDYCVGMHAKTLADSASQLPQLTMLSCSELQGLDDAVVAAMLRRGSPGWVRVGFGSSASISDGALASVARLCPRLEALYIPNLPCITATGLQQLLRSCSQLKHLCVDCCAGLADGFVQRLHKDLPFVFEGEQH